MITEQEFHALAAQGHNRIPLVAQALADLDTPLSLYLKLTQGQPNSFLLESVVGGERFGRYSFVGLPALEWSEGLVVTPSMTPIDRACLISAMSPESMKIFMVPVPSLVPASRAPP